MSKPVSYAVSHSYPNSVDTRHYNGTNLLVPCRMVKVEAILELPPHLVGKNLRTFITIEEAPSP